MKRKLVFGVGVNDADYIVSPRINGKQSTMCPFYRTWKHMLERCYRKATQDKYLTYRGCEVCDEWLTFSNFKSWMGSQNWKKQYLDKDFLGDGKTYSPETCCFVPRWLNNLFTDSLAKRGPYPIGVSYHKRIKLFSSCVRCNGVLQHLGYFDTPEKAHQVYLKAKRKYVENKMKDYPDQKIREAVLNQL